MANIKIMRYGDGTVLTADGVESVDMGLVKALFGEPQVIKTADMDVEVEPFDPFDETDDGPEETLGGTATIRRLIQRSITPEALRRAMEMGELDKVLPIRSEIDVPLVDGGTVTVVCGHASPVMVRFVFKDCWDEGVMNEENTNKTGYYGSKARRHILEDVLPKIAPEWRELIVPRKLSEVIDGKKVEYADPLWLPSATDMFGPSDGRWWNDEPDSFQLEIFKRERDRIKELGDKGTYPQWLRSVYSGDAYFFCDVSTDGSAGDYGAYFSFGFAPGFDIAAHDSE